MQMQPRRHEDTKQRGRHEHDMRALDGHARANPRRLPCSCLLRGPVAFAVSALGRNLRL